MSLLMVPRVDLISVSKLPRWKLVNRNLPSPNSTTDRKPLQFFKQVRGSHVFFLSAVANRDRPNKGDTNVIISAMDGAGITLTCCIIINGDRLFSTPAQLFSEHYNIDFMPKITQYFYPAHFASKQFLCVVPGNRSVTNVSLTSSKCSDNVGDYVPVIYPQSVLGGLAICAKTAFEKGPVPERFVEWVEIQRLLGVDKILLFNLGVPEKLEQVFRFYHNLGILDIVPYELPGVIQGVPVRGLSLERQVKPQFSHDENLPVYECRERLAGYTYVAGIDLDEIILPHRNQGLKQFMEDYLKRFPDAAGFLFHVQFHVTSWGRHAHHDVFFLDYQRSTPPRWECEKYIYLPERTHLAHTHSFEAKPSFRSYSLSRDAAIIHHYRTCPLGWATCFPEIIIDKEMLRFSSVLQQKLKRVHKYLGWA
ncbi:uncharacterized protein LOC121383915 [Gigantopelta aegis]|uniref:uncharacterized protein LOC121383915 n=1 Tax=Gigantopelta aegis TaxID=1735272 RepID=UPI001B88A8CE|nr:uncharacterized protein LOC121383915 [Gigantopelta aegis]